MLTALAPTSSASPQPGIISLDELFRRGDHYAVLNATLPNLAETDSQGATLVVTDPAARVHAALLAVKSYVALGMIGPARELLTDAYSPLSAIPDLLPLRDQLGGMPSGRIPSDLLRQRFDRNAPRLYERHPHLRAQDAVFREVPDTFEVYWSTDHNVHVSRATPGMPRSWLPVLQDLRKIASEVQLPHDPKELFCSPYLICGDHFGLLFQKVFEATSRMFMTFAPRIYMVEMDPTAIGLSLHVLEDIREWCHERVSIFTGPDSIRQLESFLREHVERAPPDACLRMPIGQLETPHELIEAIRRVTDYHHEQSRAAAKRLKTYYDAFNMKDWADAFARSVERFTRATPASGDIERPLRILGMTSRFTTVLQYAMRDLKAACEGLGCEFYTLMEPSDHDQSTTVDTITRFEAFKPDLVFLIDHHRREYPYAIPANVPFVCWVQDQLPNLMCEEAGRSIGPLDFYIAADCAELATSYQYPRAQGITWTMATNEREYDAARLPDDELAACRCDFSYVSNQSKRPDIFHGEFRERHARDAGMARILDYLFERLSREIREDPVHAPARPAGDFMSDAQRDLGLAAASPQVIDKLCRNYIHPLVELLFRQSALEWVADYCDRTGRILHVYGNGWESHPRFAKYHRGVAVNGRPLRAIYQASRINLQIIGSGAVHPRLLDGLASGGFFLIRSCALDRVHETCRQLLAYVETRGIEPDRRYTVEQMPELPAMLRAVAPIVGSRPIDEAVRLTSKDLDLVRDLAGPGARRIAGAVFDCYEEIAFDTREAFDQSADRYLSDEMSRAKIAERMRRVVLDHFTYSALIKDLLTHLRDRLAATES